MKKFFVYMLQCRDGTFYIGSTSDVKARVHKHNTSKAGAKYTRGRRPVRLVYKERHASKSKALSKEAALKRLTREQKQALLKNKVH